METTVVKSKNDAYKPFPFLKLPGELRNLIYWYFVCSTFVKALCIKPNYELTQTGCRKRKRGDDAPQQISAMRTFFSLAQANKQIRQEFRSFWIENMNVKLPLEHVSAFLGVFLAHPFTRAGMEPLSVRPPIGRITLQLKSLSLGQTQSYNLLGLLKFSAKAPMCQIRFTMDTSQNGWPRRDVKQGLLELASFCEHESAHWHKFLKKGWVADVRLDTVPLQHGLFLQPVVMLKRNMTLFWNEIGGLDGIRGLMGFNPPFHSNGCRFNVMIYTSRYY